MTTATPPAASGRSSHRESRVQFFDVQQMTGSRAAAGPLGAAADTVNALLYKYMRFYV